MSDPTHACPGRRRVQRAHFACRQCWYRLPAALRDPITANYRRDPGAHAKAMGAAWRLVPRAGVGPMSDPLPLPLDLAAVQADDALLDHVAGRRAAGAGDPLRDALLLRLLLAWRASVESEPMPRLMDTDTALALMPRRRGLLARAWARIRGRR